MKVRIIFLTVHIFLITGLIIFLAFYVYPHKVGATAYRSHLLREIYEHVKLYKQQTGNFPKTLDSLLRYDKEKEKVFFQSKELEYYPIYYYLDDTYEFDVNKAIRYQLITGQPVIYDLGKDMKEGGIGENMDAAYPLKYQKNIPFFKFMKTKYFGLSALLGFILASGISLCLYGMWKKQAGSSTFSLILTIGASIIFLIFELFVAQIILFAHLYPTH